MKMGKKEKNVLSSIVILNILTGDRSAACVTLSTARATVPCMIFSDTMMVTAPTSMIRLNTM